jgi:hypothetical protein
MRDPYKILEVPRSATEVEIKKSFQRLTEELRANSDNNDSTVATRVAQLNSAYEILGEEDKRRAFDRGKFGAERSLVSREISRTKTRRPTLTGLLMALMLAVISTLIIRDLTLQRNVTATGGGTDGSLSRSPANEERARAPRPERVDRGPPRIIFQQSNLDASDDAIPLSLKVTGEAIGLALEIAGLPTKATLSAGRRMGTGRWRILATDVDDALVRLPAGFSGPLEFAVELRLADDTIVDSGQFRLQRSPAKKLPTDPAGEPGMSEFAAAAVVTIPSPPDQDAIQPAKEPLADHEQIELLIERSQELVSKGETSEARLLLQPAAEAGNARAALALGATYDPIMLTILHAQGVAANVVLACEWYKKASGLGSQEAQERLRLLASTSVGEAEAITGRTTATPTMSAKPQQHTMRSPNRAPVSPSDPTGVYVAGERVGSDPDPNIRAQLLRDDASRELRTDSAGRQVVTEPDSTRHGR